ncbi:DUF4055 domain-containing protein [Pseudochrobactrum sp. MP213Fo]|uniref:DUF4055 domain-containing protein n=1 Tax=Pseudochrobactrum sp. MP213Fo TaxID=3022250 RepID=UPI003B9ED9E9
MNMIGTKTTAALLEPSADYNAMRGYWRKVAAITGGVDAMRKGSRDFLPQFPNESQKNYAHRLSTSKFTDIYSDIVENIASKPFSKEVSVKVGKRDDLPEPLKSIVEDIDGAGNHLHKVAGDVFYYGIHNAIDWIFVDFPSMPEGATLAQERAAGARPYWSRVPATRLLWADTDVIGGLEEFVFVKIHETALQTVVKNKITQEIPVERVRILKRLKDDKTANYMPPIWELWERKNTGRETWEMINGGMITIGIIPLVPFYTGRRDAGSFNVRPPMRNVAELQIEHYQQETNLKSARELTAFPMFGAEGVDPPLDDAGQPIEIRSGPSTVWYSPPVEVGSVGTFKVLEISASSLKFLSGEVKETAAAMRELGRQPLTAGTSGITQVAAAFASQKTSSAVQAWAFNLKDSLERAFGFTMLWISSSDEPEVNVHTDFAIEIGDDKAPAILMDAYKEAVISRQTLRNELQRRSILSPEFNNKEEEERIASEVPANNYTDNENTGGEFETPPAGAKPDPIETA